MNVIIITPARNEGVFLEGTIECMRNQTVLPKQWIIVNDGSNDGTEAIVKKYVDELPFITYITLEDRGFRLPGSGVVDAFYSGFSCIKHNYDIISKLDADVQFPKNMIEIIIKAFKENHKLGITGPIQYEKMNNEGEYKRVYCPRGYVAGPHKFYRKECFEDINGLIRRAGWDGVDIIKAKIKGWETGEIDNLILFHLKSTGTAKGEGTKKACLKYGDVSYYMGGYFWYFLLRVIYRTVEQKNIKVGYYMIQGFLRSMHEKSEREPMEFRKYLKYIQRENTINWFRDIYPK